MWKIYYYRFNNETQKWECGVLQKEYKRQGYAIRVALQKQKNNPLFRWTVVKSGTDPFNRVCNGCGCTFRTEGFPKSTINAIAVRVIDYRNGAGRDFDLYDLCPDCFNKVYEELGKIFKPNKERMIHGRVL